MHAQTKFIENGLHNVYIAYAIKPRAMRRNRIANKAQDRVHCCVRMCSQILVEMCWLLKVNKSQNTAPENIVGVAILESKQAYTLKIR